ncbi:MAG: hypothetical protein AAF492_03980, partial [Verrucomicrobiota bacterium]
GSATARLGRLPRGVEMVGEPVRFTQKDETLTFTIKAGRDTLLGKYTSIFCDMEFTEKGNRIRLTSGYGQLRIDPNRSQLSQNLK